MKVSERTPTLGQLVRKAIQASLANVRVAIPGTIVSFNSSKQTVSVQPTIKERVIANDKVTWQSLPLLPDVPLVMPRAGGFLLSLPVTPGDEVLVVFGDMCIDGWWQSGGVQKQVDRRRHDLSDGFAILGTWSQPKKVSGYSTDSLQIRNDAGDTVIELQDGKVKITAGTSVEVDCSQIALSDEWGNLKKLVMETFELLFNTHTHLYHRWPDGALTETYVSSQQMDDTHMTSKVKGK